MAASLAYPVAGVLTLRKKGMSQERAAKIANASGSSKQGGENSGGGKSQKQKAGRKGGKKSS